DRGHALRLLLLRDDDPAELGMAYLGDFHGAPVAIVIEAVALLGRCENRAAAEIAQPAQHRHAAVGDQETRVGHEVGMPRPSEPRRYDRLSDMSESRGLDQHSRELAVTTGD